MYLNLLAAFLIIHLQLTAEVAPFFQVFLPKERKMKMEIEEVGSTPPPDWHEPESGKSTGHPALETHKRKRRHPVRKKGIERAVRRVRERHCWRYALSRGAQSHPDISQPMRHLHSKSLVQNPTPSGISAAGIQGP
jgi:hypothetical protein